VVTLALGLGVLSSRAVPRGAKHQADADDFGQTMAEVRWAGLKGVKYSTDFEWAATPADDLGVPGTKTIHLAPCPSGVTGSELAYSVYIAGTGTPEAVKVNGGTCKGDGTSGTLQFTTVNTHSAGYTIQSATAGIQEASIAAKLDIVSGNNYTYKEGGYIRVPPGVHKLYAPLAIIANGQTIDFTGGFLVCEFDADCLVVGRLDNYNATSYTTLISPRGIPSIRYGQHSFITVFGQHTRVFNVNTFLGKRTTPTLPENYGNFGHIVTVVADQAFLLDGLDGASVLTCTSRFCGSAVFAPGPFSGAGSYGSRGAGDNAALGWLKNLNIGPQCRGNGVDWQAGNTLHISDSVIQGYAQFGVRVGQNKGGYGMTQLDDVYEEVGNCTNPLGNVGIAGVIVQGGKLSMTGGEMPKGNTPVFANTGSASSYYYLIAKDLHNRPSNLLYAGSALANKSGTVTIMTNDVPGATTFDLLKSTSLYQAPFGTGDWAVATGATRASACSSGVCKFTDTQAAPKRYTVSSTPPEYFSLLPLWNGDLVLGPSADGSSVVANASAYLTFNDLNAIALWQTNTAGFAEDTVDSIRCILMPGSPVWQSCLGQVHAAAATLLYNKRNNDGGLSLNMKGRLNLLSAGSGPNHIITLVDANPSKTLATGGNRPPNDPNDTFIGYDQGTGNPAQIALSLGAPVAISSYIGNTGDGKSWKERLTESQKVFAVPVAIQSGSTLTVGSGTPLSQLRVYKTNSVAGSNVPGQSCVDIKAAVPGLTDTDQITGLKPPKPLGNLSVNGYASAANTVTLHFCNPASSSVGIPSGMYSFLAVH